MSSHTNPFARGVGEVLGVTIVLLSLAWILCVEMPLKAWKPALSIMFLLVLCGCAAEQPKYSPEPIPLPMPRVAFAQSASSDIQSAKATAPTLKQQYLVWDSDKGASNRVSWGLARDAWTNGNRVVSSNSFPITNGWHYKVTSILNGIESTPALWPSNRFDRIWIQTSTNLSIWKDALAWQTNYNRPQEYLRLRAELIRWE